MKTAYFIQNHIHRQTTLAFLLIFILYTYSPLQAQVQNQDPIAEGTILLITNEKVPFQDLKYEDDKVIYFNPETGKQEHLFLPSIQQIIASETSYVSSKSSSSANALSLKEGVYASFQDLLKAQPTANTQFTMKELRNGYFKFHNAEKKLYDNTIFAIVMDGQLYVRMSAVHNFASEHTSLRFSKAKTLFTRMTCGGTSCFAYKVPFNHETASILGSIVIGVASGLSLPLLPAILVAGGASGLWFMAMSATRDVEIHFDTQTITLIKR